MGATGLPTATLADPVIWARNNRPVQLSEAYLEPSRVPTLVRAAWRLFAALAAQSWGGLPESWELGAPASLLS